jgi:hypothetical protein
MLEIVQNAGHAVEVVQNEAGVLLSPTLQPFDWKSVFQQAPLA